MILQRYILRELVLSFAFTFVAILAVCLVGVSFQVFRNFQGLGADLLVRMMPLALGYMAPRALLVAACTSATLVYGRLTSENEIDAMRMCGIHANHILAPAVFFGLFLSTGSYALNEYAAPAAADGQRRAIKESVLLVLKRPPPGKQSFKLGPYQLSYLNIRDGVMEDLDLLQYDREDNLEADFHAKSGRAVLVEGQPATILMDKPSVSIRMPDGTRNRFTGGNEFSIPLDKVEFGKKDKKPDQMSSDELLEALGRTRDPKERARILTVYHVRYAQALAPIFLVLVSVPIGAYVKKGSRLAGLGAALPPLLIYFVVFFIFQGMGEKGRIAPLAAAYAPVALLLALSAPLLAGVYRR